MDFSSFFNQVLFQIGTKEFTVLNMVYAVLAIVVITLLYRLVFNILIPKYYDRVKPENLVKPKRAILFILFLATVIGLIWSFELDYVLFENELITFTVVTALQAILILLLARLFDWVISKALAYNYQRSRHDDDSVKEPRVDKKPSEKTASRTVQYAVYIFAAILILESFQIDYILYAYGEYEFKISTILWVVFIFLVARLSIWVVTQLALFSYYRRNEIDVGSRYAINQLVKYIVYVIAVFVVLDNLGIQMTVIWGGLAALLVGIGLGLQQTFNDLLSGILLLFERSVEVGDVVQIDGLIGSVKRIGLRASIIETRENVTVIVPNSKLVTNSVINWSHFDDKVRFKINVGVAYGSDTQKVKKILIRVATDSIYVLDAPPPLVRFVNFGDSSLDFELHFWSRNFLVIEDIKSDLRFAIDEAFRENDVTIPFPQRDVWMKDK